MYFHQVTVALIQAVAILSTEVEGSCPDGFCRHSGLCYLVVGLNVTWIEARSYCPVLGGSLLVISSSAEQTAAEGVLRKSKGSIFPGHFWLDITDLLNPKEWKSMKSRSALSYENWDSVYLPGNDTAPANCAFMSEENAYFWQPAPCAGKMNFVCYASGESRSRQPYRYNRYNRYSNDYDDDDNDISC